MARVLVVEDQKRLAASLRRGLEEEGYEVVTSFTGEEGYYAATTQSFDALVLDLMLPGRDGLQVLRDLRTHGLGKPVLILTARDTVEDRVAGLDAGADDYLLKPFAFAELLVRLRALLRRNVGDRELCLRASDLEMEMDLLARRVVRAGIEVELGKREFELLEYLLRHKNQSVTRDNAIKYTGAGGTVNVTSRSSNGASLVVITDTGIGIPRDHIDRVFDRFYRVDPARSGDENGAGLGLSICNSIVRSTGGEISIESHLKNGTTVTVSFPQPPVRATQRLNRK